MLDRITSLNTFSEAFITDAISLLNKLLELDGTIPLKECLDILQEKITQIQKLSKDQQEEIKKVVEAKPKCSTIAALIAPGVNVKEIYANNVCIEALSIEILEDINQKDFSAIKYILDKISTQHCEAYFIAEGTHADTLNVEGANLSAVAVKHKECQSPNPGQQNGMFASSSPRENISKYSSHGSYLDFRGSTFVGQEHTYSFTLPPKPPKEKLPKIWHLPEETSYFTGRTELLEEMKKTLDPKNLSPRDMLTVCHGLGGVGKTQLSLQYGKEHIEEYKGVMFFSADTKEKLIQEYIDLGEEELNLFENKEKLLPEKRAAIVKNWLENPKRAGWLLIYDNAYKYDNISELLPTRGGKILITSRHTEWKGKKIPIDVFTFEESRNYVTTITDKKNDKLADILIEKLGKLPLALAQACAYIKRNKKSLKEYLDLYEKSCAELLAKNLFLIGDNHQPVAVTWNVTLEKMQQESLHAVELIYCCVCLNNENIPIDLANYFFIKKGDKSQEMIIDEAKRICEEYSMLRIDDVRKSLSMHCLVHEVLQTQLKSKKKLLEYIRRSVTALIKNYEVIINEKQEDFKLKKKLFIHIYKILELRDEHFKNLPQDEDEKDRKQLVFLLTYLGDAFSLQSNMKKQGEILKRALPFAQDHVKHSSILQHLGMNCILLGNLELGEEYLEKALSICKKKYGENNPQETIPVLGSLSIAYIMLGKIQKGKKLLEDALATIEKSPGENYYLIALIQFNLGFAYTFLGDVCRAKNLLENALLAIESYYGNTHIMFALILSNIGIANVLLGDAEGEKKIDKAIDIIEEYQGEVDYLLTIISNGLAIAHLISGKLQKGKELLEKSLNKLEKSYNKNCFQIALTLNCLGIANVLVGKAQEAKEQLEKALSILEPDFRENYFDILSSQYGLGLANIVLGNTQIAKNLLENVLEALKQYYDENHFQVVSVSIGLGLANIGLGNAKTAKELFEKTLNTLEKHYNKNRFQIAITLHGLGLVNLMLNKAKVGKELFERALKILTQDYDYDQNHVQVALTLSGLGIANVMLWNTKPGKKLLEESLPILKKHYGESHFQVASILNVLGIANIMIGDIKLGKELLEQTLPILKKHYGESHFQIILSLKILGAPFFLLPISCFLYRVISFMSYMFSSLLNIPFVLGHLSSDLLRTFYANFLSTSEEKIKPKENLSSNGNVSNLKSRANSNREVEPPYGMEIKKATFDHLVTTPKSSCFFEEPHKNKGKGKSMKFYQSGNNPPIENANAKSLLILASDSEDCPTILDNEVTSQNHVQMPYKP